MILLDWYHHPGRRPLWQIPPMLLAWLLYVPCRLYVDFFDRI